MPLTTSATNGSAIDVTTTPIEYVRPVARLRPTALTRKLTSAAMRRMRSAVSALTSGLFLSARETVECDTFAARAMSLIESVSRLSMLDADLGARGPLASSDRIRTRGMREEPRARWRGDRGGRRRRDMAV